MSQIIILMPHYNSEADLVKSILSIDETNLNIDVLIIDDGSTTPPNLSEIKEQYKLGSVFLDVLDENKGIEGALNRGLEIIEKMDYKYIGRLDCGDFCVKNRFTKQINYLEKNKDVFLLGTWANIKNTKGELLYVLKHPITHKDIKKKMFVNNMFVHPSVVFRKILLEKVKGYPTNYKAAEDYAFFFKIIREYKGENLPEPLLDYIIDDNSISSKKRVLQVKNRIRVILHNFRFGIYPIYGLIRNVILLFISRDTTTFLKKFLTKK